MIKLDLNTVNDITLGDVTYFPEEWGEGGESANHTEFWTRALIFTTSSGEIEIVAFSNVRGFLERLELKPAVVTPDPEHVTEPPFEKCVACGRGTLCSLHSPF